MHTFMILIPQYIEKAIAISSSKCEKCNPFILLQSSAIPITSDNDEIQIIRFNSIKTKATGFFKIPFSSLIGKHKIFLKVQVKVITTYLEGGF